MVENLRRNMRASSRSPTWINCKELNPHLGRERHRIGTSRGLSKSRALFDFQRAETRQTPLAWREADGELSLRRGISQQTFLRGLVPAARARYARSPRVSSPKADVSLNQCGTTEWSWNRPASPAPRMRLECGVVGHAGPFVVRLWSAPGRAGLPFGHSRVRLSAGLH